MNDRIVLPRRPPGVECLSWCWCPADSSENESRLSVDCPPFRIRVDIGGEGETRFSGDDSSAKLWSGGEVSEPLTPDFDPTEKKVEL